MPKRLEQMAIAFDQLINTLFGGWADETISSRAHRMQGKSRKFAKLRKLIDGLFFWQEEHCLNAFRSETERRHLPPEMRSAEAD